MVWSIVGVVVLVLGLVLPLWGLKHYQKLMQQKQGAAPTPAVTNQPAAPPRQ